ncbi:MAG: choice-of-anchor Q domain-containing protein, partial [Dokdonella sp.]
GIGHAIGVRAGSSEPTILWMFHATMRRASTLTATTVGSLLSIRGSAANVRVLNSLVDGTCAISEGGAMFQAVGNIESTGFTCGMNTTINQLGVPANALRIGSLAEHGGFTRTFLPQAGSPLLGNASSTWCPFTFGIDQRRFVRPTTWVGCDVGAVEAGAVSDLLFDDDFE